MRITKHPSRLERYSLARIVQVQTPLPTKSRSISCIFITKSSVLLAQIEQLYIYTNRTIGTLTICVRIKRARTTTDACPTSDSSNQRNSLSGRCNVFCVRTFPELFERNAALEKRRGTDQPQPSQSGIGDRGEHLPDSGHGPAVDELSQGKYMLAGASSKGNHIIVLLPPMQR
ncbi:MAG: hypothetical protein E5W01_00820 [Mesorhizobium sp.]|nr:MAG: hypothetical protein E5W01_00820 [Mesorhizobium sp.]